MDNRKNILRSSPCKLINLFLPSGRVYFTKNKQNKTQKRTAAPRSVKLDELKFVFYVIFFQFYGKK